MKSWYAFITNTSDVKNQPKIQFLALRSLFIFHITREQLAIQARRSHHRVSHLNCSKGWRSFAKILKSSKIGETAFTKGFFLPFYWSPWFGWNGVNGCFRGCQIRNRCENWTRIAQRLGLSSIYWHHYCYVIHELKADICCKWSNLRNKQISFKHDNACPHSSEFTTAMTS